MQRIDSSRKDAARAGVIECLQLKIWDSSGIGTGIAPGGGGTNKAGEFSNRAINEYKEQRNFPSVGTSQLCCS